MRHFYYLLGPVTKRLQVTPVLVQVRLIIRLVLVALVDPFLHVVLHQHVNVRIRFEGLLVVDLERLLAEKVVEELLSHGFVLFQLL